MKEKTKRFAEKGHREHVGYRKVIPIKPEILAACRNCGHYARDHNDREGAKGVYFEITNSRCLKHGFSVNRNTVCDDQKFRYADRRDV